MLTRALATASWLLVLFTYVVACSLPRQELATADPDSPQLGAVLGPVVLTISPGARPCAYVTRLDGARLGLIWRDDLAPRVVGLSIVSGDQVLASSGDRVWLGGGTLRGVHEKLQGCPVDGTFLVGDVFTSDPLSG